MKPSVPASIDVFDRACYWATHAAIAAGDMQFAVDKDWPPQGSLFESFLIARNAAEEAVPPVKEQLTAVAIDNDLNAENCHFAAILYANRILQTICHTFSSNRFGIKRKRGGKGLYSLHPVIIENWPTFRAALQELERVDANRLVAQIKRESVRAKKQWAIEIQRDVDARQRRRVTGKRHRKRKSGELTERQIEALRVVGECKGNIAEAARHLGLSRATVGQHYQAALRKAGKVDFRQLKLKGRRLPEDHRGQSTIADED